MSVAEVVELDSMIEVVTSDSENMVEFVKGLQSTSPTAHSVLRTWLLLWG